MMAAGNAAMSGQWVEAAAAYASIVQTSNNKKASSFVLRSWAVKGLASICFQQLAGRVPAAHIKMLKHIARGKYGDSLQLRCFALRALGLIAYDKGDRNGAAEYVCVRSVIKTVVVGVGGGGGVVGVGRVFAAALVGALSLLALSPR
jgi:hypothetical protein